jgi:hypothetical protein
LKQEKDDLEIDELRLKLKQLEKQMVEVLK